MSKSPQDDAQDLIPSKPETGVPTRHRGNAWPDPGEWHPTPRDRLSRTASSLYDTRSEIGVTWITFPPSFEAKEKSKYSSIIIIFIIITVTSHVPPTDVLLKGGERAKHSFICSFQDRIPVYLVHTIQTPLRSLNRLTKSVKTFVKVCFHVLTVGKCNFSK